MSAGCWRTWYLMSERGRRIRDSTPVYIQRPFWHRLVVPIGTIADKSRDNDRINPDRDVFLIAGIFDAIFIPKGTMMAAIVDTKALGTLVRAERKSQALTQEQLAGLAGVGIRFVRELEAGKESCQLGRALLVAQTLGLVVSVSTRRENRP